jgi:xanthine/CO dehydrogenase XdhC/CoxF family maturation factor
LNEIGTLCRAWVEASRVSEHTWLATVTGVEGLVSHRLGARLLFNRRSVIAGAVSGGSLERELARTGPWLTRNGPLIHVFDCRSGDDERRGNECEGRVHLLLEPLTPVSDGALSMIARELAAERRVAVMTILQTDVPGLPVGARLVKTQHGLVSQVPNLELSRTLTRLGSAALGRAKTVAERVLIGATTALLEVLEPPPHLFVFGAEADAVSVVRFAALLGWSVTVCAGTTTPSRERFDKLARISEQSLADDVTELDRCARPLALVMSHEYSTDRSVVAALLETKARYVGIAGPAHRTQRMLDEIERTGRALDPECRARLFGPAGLALGAETAEELALSVLAEAQTVLAESEPVFLSERSGTVQTHAADSIADALRLAATRSR